jgi:hypothetical protein
MNNAMGQGTKAEFFELLDRIDVSKFPPLKGKPGLEKFE